MPNNFGVGECSCCGEQILLRDWVSTQLCAQCDMKRGGTKLDHDKPRTDLLPTDVLEGVAQVLTVGAKKYADRNWEKGMKWSRPYGALLRHLWAFWRGEELDPETGLPHIDQVVTNAMFLARYWRTRKELDDRPQAGVIMQETDVSFLPSHVLCDYDGGKWNP